MKKTDIFTGFPWLERSRAASCSLVHCLPVTMATDEPPGFPERSRTWSRQSCLAFAAGLRNLPPTSDTGLVYPSALLVWVNVGKSAICIILVVASMFSWCFAKPLKLTNPFFCKTTEKKSNYSSCNHYCYYYHWLCIFYENGTGFGGAGMEIQIPKTLFRFSLILNYYTNQCFALYPYA